jgi:hypothetical protein
MTDGKYPAWVPEFSASDKREATGRTEPENDSAFCDRLSINGIRVWLGIPRMSATFAAGDMPPVSATVTVCHPDRLSAADREEIRAWAAEKVHLPASRVLVGDERAG